jgi:DNA-directed RNA polymerase subunit beta
MCTPATTAACARSRSPEGPNIGLIGSLATFGRVNPFGFIETPYRKVDNGHVTNEVVYMTADQEAEHVIAQANQEIDDKGNFVAKTALVRDAASEADDVPIETVDYMDVSPRQMVSVGASLIPFLEHDEGHRALMGTNMQRQAVPLVKSERPLVGTGWNGAPPTIRATPFWLRSRAWRSTSPPTSSA